jgi:hypothetical protein
VTVIAAAKGNKVKQPALRVLAAFVPMVLLISVAWAGPPNQLVPPYEGSSYEFGGCAHYDGAIFGEICNGHPWVGLSMGQVGGFTRVESADFGQQPLILNNRAMADTGLAIRGTLRKAASILPIAIHVQIDAEASFTGTRGLSSDPIDAYARLRPSFTSNSAAVYPDTLTVVDNDASTAAPQSYSGEVVFQMTAYNVAKGDFAIGVASFLYTELFRGDAGTSLATMDARVTAVQLG